VRPGATLGDVDRETHVFGLAVPAGVIARTGIAGLRPGGGVGWLVRKYGLACDNVVSFEVVPAGGVPIVASASRNRDLFWALRVGGGSFGVITSFEYRARPLRTILGGMLVHPRDRAAGVLRFCRDFVALAPEELTVYAALMHTPDGVPAVAVVACYCGDIAQGERVLGPLRGFGRPMVDAIAPMPFPQVQTLLDGAFPDSNHDHWKSAFPPAPDDAAIDVVVDRANRAASPLGAIVVEYYGGAAGRVRASGTAFAHWAAEYDIGALARWTDPSEAERHIEWARSLAAALEPFASGAYLLNFLDEEDRATIQAAFGANYKRLRAVKKKYDPDNFLRVNQNIGPAG
jgi:hypothetical protein